MKTTKFNYRKNDQITTVESNEIITSKTKIKFNNDFYTVIDTYFDMDKDGNTFYIHNCELAEK
jgi:hypothetical protein